MVLDDADVDEDDFTETVCWEDEVDAAGCSAGAADAGVVVVTVTWVTQSPSSSSAGGTQSA